MARLVTSGAEVANASAASGNARTDPDGLPAGSPSVAGVVGGTKRSGNFSFDVASSGTTDVKYQDFGFTSPASGVAVYARAYVRLANLPTNAIDVLTLVDGAGVLLASARVTPGGKFRLFNNVGAAQIGSDSALTLAANRWYRVQLKLTINTASGANDGAELLVADDGGTDELVATTATATISTTMPARLYTGRGTASASPPGNAGGGFIDDVAVNDGTGAFQNGYPGEGKVILIIPASTNVRGNWTDGIGGTSGITNAIDNKPPVGLVLASATAASQIKNTTSGATENYDANCTNYTNALIPADALITCIYAIANMGNSTTTSITTALAIVSNPAIAEVTATTGTTAAGTYPTGWTWMQTAYAYNPAVTRGTQPIIRVGKRTATTDAAMFDAAFIIVEYQVAPYGPPLVKTVAGQVAASRLSRVTHSQVAGPNVVAALPPLFLSVDVRLAARARVQRVRSFLIPPVAAVLAQPVAVRLARLAARRRGAAELRPPTDLQVFTGPSTTFAARPAGRRTTSRIFPPTVLAVFAAGRATLARAARRRTQSALRPPTVLIPAATFAAWRAAFAHPLRRRVQSALRAPIAAPLAPVVAALRIVTARTRPPRKTAAILRPPQPSRPTSLAAPPLVRLVRLARRRGGVILAPPVVVYVPTPVETTIRTVLAPARPRLRFRSRLAPPSVVSIPAVRPSLRTVLAPAAPRVQTRSRLAPTALFLPLVTRITAALITITPRRVFTRLIPPTVLPPAAPPRIALARMRPPRSTMSALRPPVVVTLPVKGVACLIDQAAALACLDAAAAVAVCLREGSAADGCLDDVAAAAACLTEQDAAVAILREEDT